MSTSNLQVEGGPEKAPLKNAPARDERSNGSFSITLVEPPTLFVSAYRQVRDWLREPKVTVPAEYYRGEVKLPATDLRPWFYDLPSQLKIAFEKPGDPVGIFNYAQQEKRALCAVRCCHCIGSRRLVLEARNRLAAAGIDRGICFGRIGGLADL